MCEVLPGVAPGDRSRAGNLIETTLGEVGASFSSVPRAPDEIEAYAGALADMLCAYLERLMTR